MGTNDAWLAQIQEEVLDPLRPICDPHHHLWDKAEGRIEPRYLLDEILLDTGSGHNVVSTVYIEHGEMYRPDGPDQLKPVGEVEFANGIAAMSASGLYGPTRVCAGIVGHADLRHGAAAGETLDAMIAAGSGRFRGIRHGAAWDAAPEIPDNRTNPGPHLFMDEKFRVGFAELAPRGLTFDAWCNHPQIPDLTDLARAFPDTTIVLNHFGAPLCVGPYRGKREEVFERWRKDIAVLADCPNVYAKLGGLNMEFNGFDWHLQPKPPTSEELASATGRYFMHTIEQFGPARCMFESNFPVDEISCSYSVLWNSFKRLAADFSETEKDRLFRDTAVALYSL